MNMDDDLNSLEQEIRKVDEQLLADINRRYELLQKYATPASENEAHEPYFTPAAQAALQKRILQQNQGPAKNETIAAVFREVISGAIRLTEPVTVAYLGPENTFTHQATLAKFGHSVEQSPQKTIADVFDAVMRGNVTYGVVPVENSTEGAVTHTLDMFTDTSVSICAEVNINIHHNLLSNCDLDELTVVYSHPQVFAQCRRWLQENLHHADLIEVASTVEATERCKNEKNAGAIASKLAAERHSLNISATNIEDFSQNTTRFLVLGTQDSEPTGDDKTSMLFAVKDRVGALYDSLLPFRHNGINLSMIESRPSRRRSWDYNFFIDFSGHFTEPYVREAIEELKEQCQFTRILGSYPRGAAPMS